MDILTKAWQFLTNPHPTIIDIEEKRQSQLLAGLIASLFFTSLAASVLLVLSDGGVSGTVVALWFSMAFILVVYWLNRSGRYRPSAFIFVGFNLAVTYLMAPVTGELAWLFFSVMVLLLCAMLLPDFTVALFFAGMVLHFALATFFPLKTSMSNIAATIVYLVIGPLVLVFLAHRTRLEKERQQELQTINESLRLSEAELESRVIGRTAELHNVNKQMQENLKEINLLREKLQDEAIRDPLTGLFNRRYLEETLVREIGRARREEYEISFMLFDIDHFKRLNDTHGHDAGDLVLKALSETLVARIRTADIPCRIGGEEFLLVLPGIVDEVAQLRAEYFRDQIQAMRVVYGNKSLDLTVSIGVSFYPRNGENWAELYRVADKALYRAKQNGRNRVECA